MLDYLSISSLALWAIPLVFSLAALILYLIPRSKLTTSSPPIVKSNVPIPLIGPCIEFGKSPMKMVKRCYDEYGPVFTVPIFHKRLTFLVGPVAQEPFFKLGDEALSQQEVYDFMKPVFGPGIVYDAPKKKRQVQFQSLAHGLRVSRLKGYVPKIEKETINFLKEWGDSGEIDILEALSQLTILTASRCLHGNDVREKLFREVAKLYHDLDQGVTPLTVFWPNAPTKAHSRRNAARLEMVSLFSKVIEERRNNPTAGSDGTDILSILMELKYKDGKHVTNEEVTGLLIALLFAGQHTSCITSTWTSLFIANDCDIIKRVVEEQSAICGTCDAFSQSLDFDKVNQMELLQDCMREALRLCPPLILLMRKAMKTLTVTGAHNRSYVVPEGDMVMVSPSVAMRLPEVFKDPDRFDPDRFGEGREEHKIPYAYLGFGGGMHSCMGQNFAFLQVKTILSVLFRQFEIELISGKMPDCDFEAMVVGPKGDCRVRYKRRQPSFKA